MPLSGAAVPVRDAEVPVFFFAAVVPLVVFEAELVVVLPVTDPPAALSVGPAVTAGTVDDAAVVSALD
jgi:hypothetical protein